MDVPWLKHRAGHGGGGTWKWIAIAALLFIAVDKSGVLLDSSAESGLNGRSATELVGYDSTHRALASGTTSSHQASTGDANAHSVEQHSGHGEHGHPHEAMYFLVGSIMIGTLVMQLTRLPLFQGLQQTVVLFVLGCCCSFALEGAGAWEHLGGVGRSYSMWMVIDPHLVLFTLLPPLLAGDAMTIDMNVFFKVVCQCLYLAGPGVLINAMLTGLFLWVYLPYDWPYLLCLTAGAILCATDPVAVVALLKELGASPVLTVQIQGESLLNDGTAIVLYMISYRMLKGETYTNEDVVVFLTQTALYAWILGMVIGGIFFVWIRLAKNKFDHNSGMIQVALTICCAYSSFIVAEGILHISGVLSTVAAALVLAYRMWPEIVDREMMGTIWHTFEYLGNTVIFFLAGALTGNIMLRTPWEDYLHLLVIYAVLTVARAVLIFLSRPLLKVLAADWKPVTLADAAVMTWGGLRGAVGLALAIQVSIDRAGGTLSSSDADRVLFYVGGVALLTLVVNATTCPALVRWLGITQVPEAKRQLMLTIHQQMADQLEDKDLSPASRKCLETLLHDVGHHLQFHGSGNLKPTGQESASWTPTRLGEMAKTSGRMKMDSAQRLLVKHHDARERYERSPPRLRERLSRMLPADPVADQQQKVIEIVRQDFARPVMLRAINEAFMKLVRSQYWTQIEHGEVSTSQARRLLSGIATSLSAPCWDVNNLETIYPDWEEESPSLIRGSVRSVLIEEVQPSCLHTVVTSMAFTMFIALSIMCNIAFVLLDYYINSVNSNDALWFGLEVAFTGIFVIEIMLRMADEKLQFFCQGWNLFDLVLVTLGIVGVVLHWLFMDDQSGFGAKEAQLARIVRVFKVLRVLRMVRLVRIMRIVDARLRGKERCDEVAEHMQRFDLLLAFIKAHRGAQSDLLGYFGRRGEVDSVEVARCILQSQIAVFKAMTLCTIEEEHLQGWLLDELRVCQGNLQAAREMEVYLLGAHKAGVLTSSEAESLVHTIHHHMHKFAEQVVDMRHGRALEPIFATAAEEEKDDEEQDDEEREKSEEEKAVPEPIAEKTFTEDDASEGSEKRNDPPRSTGGSVISSRSAHNNSRPLPPTSSRGSLAAVAPASRHSSAKGAAEGSWVEEPPRSAASSRRSSSRPPEGSSARAEASSRQASQTSRHPGKLELPAADAQVEDRETSSTRSSTNDIHIAIPSRRHTRCSEQADVPSPRALRCGEATPVSSRLGNEQQASSARRGPSVQSRSQVRASPAESCDSSDAAERAPEHRGGSYRESERFRVEAESEHPLVGLASNRSSSQEPSSLQRSMRQSSGRTAADASRGSRSREALPAEADVARPQSRSQSRASYREPRSDDFEPAPLEDGKDRDRTSGKSYKETSAPASFHHRMDREQDSENDYVQSGGSSARRSGGSRSGRGSRSRQDLDVPPSSLAAVGESVGAAGRRSGVGSLRQQPASRTHNETNPHEFDSGELVLGNQPIGARGRRSADSQSRQRAPSQARHTASLDARDPEGDWRYDAPQRAQSEARDTRERSRGPAQRVPDPPSATEDDSSPSRTRATTSVNEATRSGSHRGSSLGVGGEYARAQTQLSRGDPSRGPWEADGGFGPQRIGGSGDRESGRHSRRSTQQTHHHGRKLLEPSSSSDEDERGALRRSI